MLLYLNDETWLTQGDVLERDVRAGLNAAKHANANAGRLSRFRLGAAEMASGKKSQSKEKIKIILAHENDPKKGGCEFDKFFVNTPEGLVKAGIYSDVAIALHTKPHRDVSLALLAKAFGATKTGRPSVRDDMQKRLSDVQELVFPDAPQKLPGSRPSIGLGQQVSSGTELGGDATCEGGGLLIQEVQVEVHPAGPSSANQ
jgi:hypothetical protein